MATATQPFTVHHTTNDSPRPWRVCDPQGIEFEYYDNQRQAETRAAMCNALDRFPNFEPAVLYADALEVLALLATAAMTPRERREAIGRAKGILEEAGVTL